MCTPWPEFETVSLYMYRKTGSPARLLRVGAVGVVPTPPLAPVQSTSMAFAFGVDEHPGVGEVGEVGVRDRERHRRIELVDRRQVAASWSHQSAVLVRLGAPGLPEMSL